MDTIYCERANGRLEFWTYSDGSRVMVTELWARREVARGLARLIRVA
jgi:hypothetical protein